MNLILPYMSRYGVSFLDMIIYGFEKQKKDVLPENMDQYDLYKKIQANPKLKCVDEVVIFVPSTFDGEPHYYWKEFLSDTKLEEIRRSIQLASINPDQALVDLSNIEGYAKKQKAFPDFSWIIDNLKSPKDLWHIINEFDLETQVQWYKGFSSLYKNNQWTEKNKGIRIEELNLSSNDFKDENKLLTVMNDWIAKQPFDKKYLFNLHAVERSMYLVAHYFSWRLPKFKQVEFIDCAALKAGGKNRFRSLNVRFMNSALLGSFNQKLSDQSEYSEPQLEVRAKLEKYKEFDDNFSIIILGAKGTGKSKVVKDVWGGSKEVISVNCGSFKNNVQLAQSELFGYVEGAFTGANKSGKLGKFQLAANKVLFLDEIHHLDLGTQAMLLTALQTDGEGNYQFDPIGSAEGSKVKFQLIVASNIPKSELKEHLLEDLLDRISQRELQLDNIGTGVSIIYSYKKIFQGMNFTALPPIEYFDQQLLDWLSSSQRQFPGNYRDLEKLAIYVADYMRINQGDEYSAKKLVESLNVRFEEMTISDSEDSTAPKKYNPDLAKWLADSIKLDAREMIRFLKRDLTLAARELGGGHEGAVDILGVSKQTLINWEKMK